MSTAHRMLGCEDEQSGLRGQGHWAATSSGDPLFKQMGEETAPETM
jgi:hypothetical protein